MAKIEDILHTFLDGETTESQETVLIHALLERPKLREQFVRSCRIHHATLSAFSVEQAENFKRRLDSFCIRWEQASLTHNSEVRGAFGAGLLTSGIAAAAVFCIGLGAYALMQKSGPSINLTSDESLTVAAPVKHVRLVEPASELDGEPLYVTFSIAELTSEDIQAAEADPMPTLSDTFSQAYIELLRDEQNILSSHEQDDLDFEAVSNPSEVWKPNYFEVQPQSVFSFEQVSE